MTPSDWTPEVAIQEAHQTLLRAGFKMKYQSLSGSRYYHLTGRAGGMMRLSDHSAPTDDNVAFSLVFHPDHMPGSPHKLMRMVAEAIGRFILATRQKKEPAPELEDVDLV